MNRYCPGNLRCSTGSRLSAKARAEPGRLFSSPRRPVGPVDCPTAEYDLPEQTQEPPDMHPDRDAPLAVELPSEIPGAACVGRAAMLAEPCFATIERRAGHGEQPTLTIDIDRLEQRRLVSLMSINPDGVLAEKQASWWGRARAGINRPFRPRRWSARARLRNRPGARRRHGQAGR